MAAPSRTRKAAGSNSKQPAQAAKPSRDGSPKPKRQAAGATSAKPKQRAAKATSAKPEQRAAGATSAKPEQRAAKATSAKPKQQTATYVYGILPADVELTDEMPGVGDPPGQVRIIHSDGLAALVSDVDLGKPLGSPDDLLTHERIVDASAGEVPVLPARFGAVLASDAAVADELLAANHDEFEDSLSQLDGRTQYVVKGRYVEDVILNEILEENRQAARLADKLRGADPDATRDARIKLGEIINNAVSAKRRADTHLLGHVMDELCVASVVRDPTHELDAVHVAFLMDTGQESEMGQAIDDLADDWDGRIDLRLLGPMAAYDFVGTVLSES